MNAPRQTAGLTFRAVDGDVLVHDAVHAAVHVLNATAGRALELCDGAHSVADIARTLCAATGAPLGTVTADVHAIMRDFARLELVDDADGTPAVS